MLYNNVVLVDVLMGTLKERYQVEHLFLKVERSIVPKFMAPKGEALGQRPNVISLGIGLRRCNASRNIFYMFLALALTNKPAPYLKRKTKVSVLTELSSSD